MAKDYYKILGVSKNASQDEIKRAYRKLAHEYHPDKNQVHADGARFKEINEAYQVLSNPQKRSQYDQFGTVGDQGFGGFDWGSAQGFDTRDFGGFGQQGRSFSFNFGGGLGDIFEDFFGGVFSQVQTEVEIPLTAQLLAQQNKYDAIICLGAVIRGETSHYDYVCEQVSQGCQQVMMQYDIPVIFGVLTTENEKQALDRVGGAHGHKGRDSADAAIEMIGLMQQFL